MGPPIGGIAVTVLTPTHPAPPSHPPAGVFRRLASEVTARPRRVLLVWAMLVLSAAPLAVSISSALSGAGWDAQGSTAQRVRQELRRDFPALAAEAAVVVYSQSQPINADRAGLTQLVGALRQAPGAASVLDPLSVPPESGLVAADGRTALIPVDLAAATDRDRPEAAGALSRYVGALELHTAGGPMSPANGRCGPTSTPPTPRRCTRRNCSAGSRASPCWSCSAACSSPSPRS